MKWGPFFKGDEKPLREMERAELITILQKDGMKKFSLHFWLIEQTPNCHTHRAS